MSSSEPSASTSEPSEPSGPSDGSDEAVEAFWVEARRRAKLESLPGYFGPSVIASLRPPAWAFGADRVTADELVGLVLDGEKTATASAAEDYVGDESPLPEAGALDIVLDGSGRPRALIGTTAVRVVAFDEVDADHAAAEGEGDGSLAQWRAEHERFFTDNDPLGRGFRHDMPVVLERFRLLYPKPPRG
ncbi:ASCH domain-containing protein [uncultured Nocardioides sp.]|uniref:ASCH domain-containing protein n=1 Tax=uncultured Nocardioides sp. TaxID=198441 RepID=UPI0026018FF1|nr:ASCH domain-containing protein [uncultured Nocardioides sp.]